MSVCECYERILEQSVDSSSALGVLAFACLGVGFVFPKKP